MRRSPGICGPRGGPWTETSPQRRSSWRRARNVADRLPDSDPQRMAMRIGPRTMLCGTAARGGRSSSDTAFEELRHLCTAAGDQRSLAIGMAGMVTAKLMNVQRREASDLTTDLIRLVDSIGDPTLTIALSFMAMAAKQEDGEMTEVLRLAQQAIDLAGGDPTRGNLIVG